MLKEFTYKEKDRKYKYSAGQMLVELVLAMGIAAIILPALLTGLVASRQGKPQQQQSLAATELFKQTVNAVRNIRDTSWTSFAVDGTYHPVIVSNAWTFATGSATVNGFTQQVQIGDVYRDANGNIVNSGGTLDPSTKQVVTTISWTKPTATTLSATDYLTRTVNLTHTETSTTDFNAGTLTNAQVTNVSGGEVELGNDNNAKWCTPAFSSSAITLPDGPPVAVAATASATTDTIPDDTFVAVAPTASTSTKLAYVTVTANTVYPNPPVPTLVGTFTLDPTKYSNAGLVPTGIGITNSFKTTDVKYYTSPGGNLYALLGTDMPNDEVIAVQIKSGGNLSWQDSTNHIFKYWTFFDTKMYGLFSVAVTNGDFETGSTTPFTTIVNSGSGSIAASPVHAGTHSAKVTTTKTSVSGIAGGGNCSGGVRIPVNPNTTYSWSGYINAPTSNTKFKDARIRVAFYSTCTAGAAISTSDSSLVSTTSSSWTQVSGSASSGTGTYAEIQLLLDSSSNGTTSTAYFDDISMSTTSTTFSDQSPFGYGAEGLTILGNKGYVDSGGYLYTFDLSNIDSKSPTNGLDEIGCRIQLDGYDCQPANAQNPNGLVEKYTTGETGTSYSDTGTPSHSTCADGGNIELNADHQMSGVTVSGNSYIYVAVGAATNPELDIADVTSIPTTSSSPAINSNSCGTQGSGNSGWKTISSLDFDPAPNTEEAANSVYAKSDGTRAYMSSNGGIIHGGITDSDQFYIIDTSNKNSPQFLTTWPSTVAGQHYANTAESGYYNGTGSNLYLYPRRALTVQNGQRAVLVGVDGNPADNNQAQQYQVLNLSNESSPTYCGGLNFSAGFNDLTSVTEADGDNFVYMVANTPDHQLKIIQGGPDNAIYDASGTFESQTFDTASVDGSTLNRAFNRILADISQPTNTTIQIQTAVAPAVNNSCNGVSFNYIGSDGTSGTYFTPSGSTIAGIIPLADYIPTSNYDNPGRCFRYKVFLSTLDQTLTPILYDMTWNYSQ